jgi:uncharacterized Tic20 family protein
MVRSAWLSLIIFGTILGATAMWETMYELPLTDYSIQGIMNYTTPLYNLGDSIFSTITGNMLIVAMEFIDLLSAIVNVITNIFGWLANQLGNLIGGLVAWLESLGIDLSVQEPPAGCVYINGRLECL